MCFKFYFSFYGIKVVNDVSRVLFIPLEGIVIIGIYFYFLLLSPPPLSLFSPLSLLPLFLPKQILIIDIGKLPKRRYYYFLMATKQKVEIKKIQFSNFYFFPLFSQKKCHHLSRRKLHSNAAIQIKGEKDHLKIRKII